MAGAAPGGQQQNYAQQAFSTLGEAADVTRGLTGFTPQQVNAQQVAAERAAAERVQAGVLPGVDIGQYQNPFTQQVVETSLADLERQRLRQQQQGAAQAMRAGAFGGSRAGVAESLTNEAFARQAAQTAAGLRQSGFQQAQQMAQTDLARQMQASLANQQTGLQAALANQATGLQAQTANQRAALEAARANQQAGLQGAQFQLGAAQQLGGMAQQGFGMGQTIEQQIQQQELQQQALQQRLADQARQQFMGYTQDPRQGLSYVSQALGAAPSMQTQTQTMQPGLFDYLTLGAYAAPAIPGLAALSDSQLKDDIEGVKTLPNGIKVVRWKWNDLGKKLADPDQPTYGVIAQQIADIIPEAVKKHVSGYLMVDYSHPELRGI
jgi:hypothetical protein